MSCLGRLQVGVCMSLCLFSGLLHAADRYWVAGSAGDWSLPANWSTASGGAGGASVPGASDRAIFDGNGLGDCNQDVAINVRGILIQAGYTGTLRQGAGLTIILGSQNFFQAGGAFAGADGNIALNGSFTLSGGTFTSTFGTLQVRSSFTHTAGGTFAHNGGTILFSGGNATANVSVSETFHNLTLAKNHNAALTVASGDTLVVGGLFIHSDGQLKGALEARGNVLVEAAADGGTGTLYFLVPGDQNLVAGGGVTAALNVNKPSGTLDLGIGNLSINAFVLAGGGTVRSITGELTVRGAWTHTSGGTFVHNGGTVRFSGANATANVNVTENFNHLTVAKNHNATLTVSSGDTLIVEGLLTHSDGLISGTIEPRQNVVVDAAADGGKGTLSFKVAGDQELAGNGGKTAGLSLNKPSGTLDLGTSDLSVNAVILAGAGAFKSTAGTLTVRGAWTHTAGTSLFDPNGGTVLFSGASSTANVNVTESFWKLTVAKNHNATLTVASGDTLLALDALALTDGKANGQLEARANVTVGPLFDGGTAKLAYTGSNPQTYLDQGGNEPDGLVSVNKPGAVLLLASNLEATGTGQGVTVSAGTLDLAGFNLNVTGALSVAAAGTLRLQGGETVARGSLSLAAGSTVAYAGAGTYAALPLGNAYHHLTLDGPGTFRHAGALDVNGNLSVLQGTLESAGQDIALAGNWSNAGIYTSGTSTVTLDGVHQALSGDTAFHNLSKQTAVPATLTFASGSTQTVAGALTLKGAPGALLALRGSVSGTRWAIEALGTPDLLYLDVQDSENLGAEPLDATSTSLDSGNNLHWLFSGLAWSGNGSDDLWTNPANWFGGVVPGLGDTARFGAMGLKSCAVNTNVDLRELRVASGYTGTITQGAGLSFTVREFANDGTFVLGAGGRLVLTGTGKPLSGSGVANTTANSPNTIVYAGDEEIEIPAAPLVPAYHHLELAPPAGFSRYDVLRGTGGAFDFDSLALDTANGYAYLATSLSNPNRVVKVRLSDFTQVGALNLNAGESKPAASFVHQGHLYIALRMSPGRIAKIRLSDFTRVGTLTFPSGENNPISAVLDAPGGHAYFGLRTSPGRIVKVRLSDFARAGALTLAAGENELVAAAADLGAGYAYFGTFASPGKVIKLRLSDFTVASTLTLPAGEEYLHAAIADPARDALYWGTSTAPGRIVKLRLSDFARESALILEPGEDRVQSAVFDPVANKGYFGTDTNTGILVQADLGTMNRLDAFEMGPNEFNAFLSAAADLESGYAYFTTEAWVATLVKVNLFKREAVWEQAGPLDVNGDLAIGAGKLHAHSHDLSVGGNWANAGTYAPGTNTVRLDGGNQVLGGDNAFHNLVKQVTQASVLSFESGKTQALSGKLDLQGAAGNLLSVRASVPGQAWRLDACETQAIRYTDVKDTDASRGHAVYALSSVDAGNNLNVIFSAPAQVAIATPAESATSPAWVEGTVSSDVTSIKARANGGSEFDAVRLSGTTWFAENNRSAGVSPALGVVLSPSAPTHLEVTARNDFGEANAVSQDLTWVATDLSGQTFSEDSVTIRQGDSLLLTATGTGSLLSIDADGDGTYEYAGVPGQRFAHRYGVPGVYTAWAKIDGVDVGSLSVVVLYADLAKPIACEVAYRREKDVVITPAAHASQVTFGVNDPLLLETSLKGPFNTVDGQGMTIYLRALKRGTPVVTARIGGAAGPILAYKEIDEFTRDLPALWSVMLDGETRVGATTLRMRPYIPEIRWQFTMFAGTSTFANGVTSLSVNTSDLDPETGEPLFQQVVDPETGETVGEYLLELEVPFDETKYCFTAEPRQSASREVAAGESAPCNGVPCTVKVDELLLCEGEKGTLTITIEKVNTTGTLPHPVVMIGSSAKFTVKPHINCSTGMVNPPKPEVLGITVGICDVKIADTTWKGAVKVVAKSGLTILPKNPMLCLGKKQTFGAYRCNNGKAETVEVSWTLSPKTFVDFDAGAPTGPSSSLVLRTVSTGGPSALVGSTPETPPAQGTSTISVGDFSLTPNSLILNPADEGTIKLTRIPDGNVRLNYSGGLQNNERKIQVLDGANVLPENAQIAVTGAGKTLKVRFNPNYSVEANEGEVVFTPENGCDAKALKVVLAAAKDVRPPLIEQCKETGENAAEFAAFSRDAANKSKAETVNWSLSNTADFTLTATSGEKTTVKLKAEKTFGTTKVIAKKGSVAFGEATFTVYTVEFTQKPAEVCAGQSADFKAVSKPAGKVISYSIDPPALGCSIVGEGKFKAGQEHGVVKVRAEIADHSECSVTTDVRIHKLAVTLTPPANCNMAGATSTATAALDGTPVTATWSIAPNDGKVSIDNTGKITVLNAPAADSYTVTATAPGTTCTGSAPLDLVTVTYSKTHCQGFYAKGSDPGAAEDTLMVGAGMPNTLTVAITGKGPVFLIPEDATLCKVTKPNGESDGSARVDVATTDIEVMGGVLPGTDKTKKTRVLARVGAKDGPVCKVLDVYLLKPVSLRVRCRLVKGSNSPANEANPADFDLAAMQTITNGVWRPQAAATFTFVAPIDEGKINISLSNPCTEDQRNAMIAQHGSLGTGNDAVQRLMFLVKGLQGKDGLAHTPGKYSWMTAAGSGSLVVPHELGHNFGLDHGTHAGNQLMKAADLGSGDCVLTIEDVLGIPR